MSELKAGHSFIELRGTARVYKLESLWKTYLFTDYCSHYYLFRPR